MQRQVMRLDAVEHPALPIGGEMDALMRDHDGAASPLGPPEAWPPSLRTVIRLMLATQQPMFVFWGAGLLQFCNEAFRRFLGLERRLVERGRDGWDESWLVVGPQVAQVLAGGGGTWHQDQPIAVTRHGQATAAWWTYGVSPIEEEGQPGGIGGVLVLGNDVTGQHLAAEKLHASEGRLQLALEASGAIGTWDWDLRADRVVAAAHAARLHGLDPAVAAAGVPSDGPLRAVHPEDRHRVETALAQAVAGAGAFEAEYRTLAADGGVSWLHAHGRCLHDAAGRAVRFPGTILDITERRRTEDALRELTATLEAKVAERTREHDRIWRFSPDLLGIAGADGRLLAVNPAWTEGLGWTEADLRGRPFATLGHPAEPGQAGSPAMPGQAEGAPGGGQAGGGQAGGGQAGGQAGSGSSETRRMRHKDGSWRWISWQARRDDGLVYLVGRDVTAARAAAAALAEAEEALRQAQKMEAVGQLTGGIAHDFNNLLTGIVGGLHMMQRRIAEGRVADLPRYAGIALESANRAAALTQRLLAFARRQPLDPRPVDANRLVASMQEMIDRTLGPQVALAFTPSSGLWPILCDPHQLENAILNMAINARDAMPDGGRLTVTAVNARLTASEVRAWGGEAGPGDYVAIGLTDTGIGMEPDVAARAFEPFFTTKPSGQGTGLGLSMLYGFVRQSGGQLRLDTAPGRGTTLWIYLPRHQMAAVLAPAAAPPVAAGRAALVEGTVLVVEDEAAIRSLVVEVLKGLGLRVVQAAEARTGMAILHSAAAIDLLVTDVGLPDGMNGRQMAEAARLRRPDLPVLFITGYAHGALEDGGAMLEPGMTMLTKPFTLDALLTKVQEILGDADQARGSGHA